MLLALQLTSFWRFRCAAAARSPGFPWFAAWWEETLKRVLLNGIGRFQYAADTSGGRIVWVSPTMQQFRLERYGLFIVIGLMFLLPFIGREIGVDLSFALDFVMFGVKYLLHFILILTGQF